MAMRGWLRRVPPVRVTTQSGDVLAVILVLFLGLALWMYETAVWIVVWIVCAPFLGVRALVRSSASRGA